MFRKLTAAALAAALLALTPCASLAAAPANPLGAYLARDYVFVDSPALEAYLGSIAAKLLAAKQSRLKAPRVLVFSSEAFDAFTDGSAHLFISTATLRALSNEDELAALLAHELAHIVLGHPQQKDALRAFPTGIEAFESIKTTARVLKGGASAARAASADTATSLSETYAANLLWNDILAPGWNRKQERAADESGFEMMRLAGYDPSAFGTLFQKLGVASAKRSERLEKLKQVMIARAQAAARKAASSRKTAQSKRTAQNAKSGSTLGAVGAEITGTAGQLADAVGSRMTERAVEGVVDGLAGLGQDYDSPDERQQSLVTYAQGHRLSTRPARAIPRYKVALQGGEGGAVLTLDDAAIRLMNALTASDAAGSANAAKILLPATPGGKARSVHLNLAAGTWYNAQKRPDVAEQHAGSWLGAQQPPSRAYLWMADYQAKRKDYAGAIDTLERGRTRVGEAAPFLPQLVSMAKAAGRKTRAEELTMQCAAEDRQNAGLKIAKLFQGQRVPSGLYANCVARLGYEPKAAKDQNAAMEAIKHPINFGKDVTHKIRDRINDR